MAHIYKFPLYEAEMPHMHAWPFKVKVVPEMGAYHTTSGIVIVEGSLIHFRTSKNVLMINL